MENSSLFTRFFRTANVCGSIIKTILKREDRFMKRTFQPKKRQRSKVHGFRKRMSSTGGRNVIKRRRNKGRKHLSA